MTINPTISFDLMPAVIYQETPYGVAFDIEGACLLFEAANVNIVICVAVPHSAFCTNIAQAEKFFLEAEDA